MLLGITIKEKDQPVYNRYTGEQITGIWEWDDPLKQETESKVFGARFVFDNSENSSFYTMPRQNCKITVRDYIIATLHVKVASENLKLTGNDSGDKSKFGLKNGEGSYTSIIDEKQTKYLFRVDGWQNARDDQNNIIRETTMVAKSITAGGVQVAQGGLIPYRYNVSTSDVTITSMQPSTGDVYAVVVDLGTHLGDVDVTLTVDAVEPTYKVPSQAVQSASKSRKAAKKAKVQLTPTPTATPVPETELITPTPAETPDDTITTPTPSETPDITVTPPAPSETPEPVTPTVTPSETPEPSTPPDTPAETPAETPQPTPAEPTEVENPEPTSVEPAPTESPQTEVQDSSPESSQGETTADILSPQSELSETVLQAA